LVAAFRHEHGARLVEEVAGLVRLVPRAGMVEMLPETQHLRVEHGGNRVEIGTDEWFDVVTQRIHFAVARVVRLHLGETAQVEPIQLVHRGRVIEPSIREKLHIFHVLQHPLDFTVLRVEDTRRRQLVRANLDIVTPAPACVLPGEKVAQLAGTMDLRWV